MSQLEKIRNAFAKKGFREKQRITEQQFMKVLSQLARGSFDQNVAIQIWEQADTNHADQKVQIDTLCAIIVEAQEILNDKLQEVDEKIGQLILKKTDVESSNMPQQHKINAMEDINLQIDQLQKDKQEYQNDLKLVTQPFGIDFRALRESRRYTRTGRPSQSRRSRNSYEENLELQHIFYVVLAMALIEVIVIYKKYDFLNLLVLVTSMSIFMLNYFDRTYLKLCGGLTGVSVAADFMWLIMYGGSFWSPSFLSEHSSAQSGYLKFIVLLTLINIAAKVYLVYLIMKQSSVQPSDDFTINPFEGVSLRVQPNPNNLVSRSCKGGAGGFL